MGRRLGRVVLLGLAAACAIACGSGTGAVKDVESRAILQRAARTQQAEIQHILIAYRGAQSVSGAAGQRQRSAAASLVYDLYQQAVGGARFAKLVAEHSDDEATADGTTISVSPEALLAPRLIYLSLRLGVGELGIVHSRFGYHLVKRVE